MKTFITGATGFIGGHLVRRMADTDHEVICLVRDPSRASHLEEMGARLTQGDVTDKASLVDGMRGCDWVINLANLYDFWLPNKKLYSRINVDGTRNTLESALDTGVSKVLHVSTCGVWDQAIESPITEDTALGRTNMTEYTKSKRAGDELAWELYTSKGLPIVMIFPGIVMGPGDTKSSGRMMRDIVNRQMPATLYDDNVFAFVDVRDVAEAIVRALELEGNLGQKYIVAKENLSLNEIYRTTSETAGVPMPRLRMPGFVAKPTAALLTVVSDITGKPPPWGLSIDQVRQLSRSIRADGSKAERDLGITYMPIHISIQEAVTELKKTQSR